MLPKPWVRHVCVCVLLMVFLLQYSSDFGIVKCEMWTEKKTHILELQQTNGVRRNDVCVRDWKFKKINFEHPIVAFK